MLASSAVALVAIAVASAAETLAAFARQAQPLAFARAFGDARLERARHAAQAAEHLVNRNKAQFGCGVLHFADDHRKPVRRGVETAKVKTGKIGRLNGFCNA